MYRLASCVALAVAFVSQPVLAQEETIGTGPPDLGGLASLSSSGPATFGQTFRAPSPQPFRLNSVSFWFSNGVGGPDLPFRFYLTQWLDLPDRAGRAEGPVLFRSDEVFYGPSASTTGDRTTGVERVWTRYDFQVGGLVLQPSSHYVAFVSVSESWEVAPDPASVLMGNSSEDYRGGHFVCAANGGDFGALTSSAWIDTCNWGDGEDAAFEVSGVSVPEPNAYLLLLSGIMALGLIALRRREDSA